LRVEDKYVVTETPDRCSSSLFRCNVFKTMTQDMQMSLRVYAALDKTR